MAAIISLKAQKHALRKAISATLKLMPTSVVADQSQAVMDRVLSLPSFQRCRSISCYLSMPSGELDTSSLILEILDRGKTLFVPKIESKDGHMDFLRVYGKDDLNSLPSGVWGIKEPEPFWQGSKRQNVLDTSCDGLDIILLPGVAFDQSLSRLGHGKGYYDRFITSYSSTGRPRPLLVALALREQVLEDNIVPVAAHDWKMDLVVTPDGILGQEASIKQETKAIQEQLRNTQQCHRGPKMKRTSSSSALRSEASLSGVPGVGGTQPTSTSAALKGEMTCF
ncbi:putative 5-formyltetrahydrofolate cyclo-ligase [Hypsizygus marmoreus]|uniref:5-formyltetrahydrofolate cyclo-ligase n=1 Tax=Hypsizygus marmoreus TaxID=39966 RepID=A0A369KAN4_HYPMA|nr:putative 5-formyltetrahydrofolate cyclo-ligase [Hypsizygus marmoreus]